MSDKSLYRKVPESMLKKKEFIHIPSNTIGTVVSKSKEMGQPVYMTIKTDSDKLLTDFMIQFKEIKSDPAIQTVVYYKTSSCGPTESISDIEAYKKRTEAVINKLKS